MPFLPPTQQHQSTEGIQCFDVCLPGTTFPIYPGLGQAPNMLVCWLDYPTEAWKEYKKSRQNAKRLIFLAK